MPGIPAAIARPDLHVVLLDSNHKKTTFLRQAVIELKLPNVEVVTDRVELYQPEEKFDRITSRAFAELAEFVKLTRHLLAPDGQFVAMKGVYPYEEIALLPAEIAVSEVVPVIVPGLDAERHLVRMVMQ
jgi:16S rRNA (guanine527-N7)-methyltransferase